MAVEPTTGPTAARLLRLRPFESRDAERIVTWVCDAREAYWLAPRTAPPLSAAAVRDWSGPGRHQRMLVDPARPEPLGYGEVNLLNKWRREYWLGHLIIAPQLRGQGLGRRLASLLLQEAFERHGARRVSLVVFPENRAAVGCYRAVGMREEGFETHYFPPYCRWEQLLRLVATADGWKRRPEMNRSPARAPRRALPGQNR